VNAGPWKPSKPVAYLLAVLTAWPPIYFVLFMSFMAFAFASFGQRAGKAPQVDWFMLIFPAHLLTMVLMFALTAVYVVHAFRNDELASDKRTLWVIILFFGNMLAFPVYWWFYVRPNRAHHLEGVAAEHSAG
jgi:hypothetical protein